MVRYRKRSENVRPEFKEYDKYTTQDGLPSNVIYRIEEDPKGHMWISTTNGLAVLNPVNQEIKVFKKNMGSCPINSTITLL